MSEEVALGLDEIRLTGLRVKGFHGVLPDERRDGQEFVVDAVLRLDTRAAAASDDLADTVDYGGLAVGLADIVRGQPVNLIETLAARLADRCLADARVSRATVTVHKPAAPIAEPFADVAVTVHRARPDPAGAGSPISAVLALGANLGDRLATLQSAVDALQTADGVQVVAVSGVMETEPVLDDGQPDQGDYLNAVLIVRTTLEPAALLRLCQRVENEHGRKREIRWGARTLDIDIITYAEQIIDHRELTVPHPRAAGRAFVLLPWAELDPRAVLPGARPVADLAQLAPDRAGVRPRPDLQLVIPR